MATYNLLRNEFTNATFAVAFDTYTPRPHFIILPKSDVRVDPEFSRITTVQTQQLIETGKSVLACFEIDRGTLSIHRGSWKTTLDKFHGHVVVDVDSYVRIYESRIEEIPNWPSCNHVTRQWESNDDPRSYVENVRGYPYKSYLQEEVANINRIIEGRLVRREARREVPLEGCITKIIYHPKHPKIGFVGKKPESILEFQNVLSAIEKFAEEHGLINMRSKDENEGCQVCLYLGSVTTDDWKFNGEDGEDVRGHIVTSGPRFYELCPADLREAWFEEFKRSDFKCLT